MPTAPKELPVATLTTVVSKKAVTTNSDGTMTDKLYTMSDGKVPAACHSAMMGPMQASTRITFIAGPMPSLEYARMVSGENPDRRSTQA